MRSAVSGIRARSAVRTEHLEVWVGSEKNGSRSGNRCLQVGLWDYPLDHRVTVTCGLVV